MNRIVSVLILSLAFACNGLAQNASPDSPATTEDVEKYFEVTRSREMVKKMLDAMVKPMHQMTHDAYVKDKDKLPADFEEHMNKIMDDMMKDMPFDEMRAAMVPAYQKHFTKGEMDSLTAFYSSPTGQKILQEMPAIMSEAMGSMIPLMRQHIDAMQQRIQQESADLAKKPEKKPDQNQPATKTN